MYLGAALLPPSATFRFRRIELFVSRKLAFRYNPEVATLANKVINLECSTRVK